ncbi:MAG TPA: hypothetical protein VF221_01070 [Chloroflexota bacterium]
MAGLTREEFETATREIQQAWSRAQTRDAGFQVIVEFGRKYGFKNVIAAIQGRTPKRFADGEGLSEWIEARHKEEGES